MRGRCMLENGRKRLGELRQLAHQTSPKHFPRAELCTREGGNDWMHRTRMMMMTTAMAMSYATAVQQS